MKLGRIKKLIAISLIATTFLIGVAPTFAGGDTMPPRKGEQGYHGENQPSSHGYNKQNILDWTPKTDADNEFMRAKVPLQKRNKAFTATQANPKLDQEVKSLILSEDYGNSFFDSYQYNDQFAQNTLNFWQYLDYHASWHGMVTDPAPNTLFNPEAEWYERNYEFGIVNLPNPAYTNAAHKNGVQSLGCIFFPRAEHTVDVIYKDENGRFPVADKLVEMAKYYGFDGYFLNAEESQTAEFMPLYVEFVQAMTEQGIYIQTYASDLYGKENEEKWGKIDYYNKSAQEFTNWLKTPDGKIASNSLYMNPDPSKEQVDSSVKAMLEMGLDPKSTVFNTLEAGQTGFSGERGSLYNTYDENLVPRTAIASLGTGHTWTGIDETLFGHSGHNAYNENRRGNADYQKYAFARERIWWSGASDAPYYTNAKGDEKVLKQVLDATPDPVATANNPARATQTAWPGLSAFISERSVIDGTNFYTNFNTGHGLVYYTKGKVSNEHEWANMNIQDILPTWQWWIDKEEHTNRLKVDFDYGSKYASAFDYEKVGGYKGGSSLVVKGDLNGENFLRLYKTDLGIGVDSKLSITFNKPSATDSSEMKVGLIFEDAPDKVEYIKVPQANKQTGGWVTETLDLSQYKGKTIATIGIAFDSTAGESIDYQMNIGELKVSDGKTSAPKVPTGLKIDKAFNTSEMYISWDLDNYEEVQKYNVYAEYADGKEMYMGGIYDNVFYIKSLYNPQGNVKIKVTAVGKNGEESEPAIVERNFDQVITDIEVTKKNGTLDVSWKNPSLTYDSIKADVTFDYSDYTNATTTIDSTATTAQIKTPIADGSQNRKYTLRLSLLDKQGNVISFTDYTSELADEIGEVYKGTVTKSSTGFAKMTMPTSYDWWKLYAYQDGKALTIKEGEEARDYAIRGTDDLEKIKLINPESNQIEIILEDYEGNKSKPVTLEMEQLEEKDTYSILAYPLETVPGEKLRTLYKKEEVERLKSDLALEIKKIEAQIKDENIKYYDIKPVATIDGKTWYSESSLAKEAVIPIGGVEGILPYPKETNGQDYEFVLIRIVSSGEKLGQIEQVEVEPTEDGLKFNLDSSAPFTLGWKLKK